MEARIAKEAGKRVERTAGYDDDEKALRREFGSDMELDELEAAAGLMDTGGGHGRHEPRREHGPNPGALVGWCSSKMVWRRNRMLKKPIKRIGRMVLSPLPDLVYICNKIKLNYAC